MKFPANFRYHNDYKKTVLASKMAEPVTYIHEVPFDFGVGQQLF
jgi:hypothetical protein